MKSTLFGVVNPFERVPPFLDTGMFQTLLDVFHTFWMCLKPFGVFIPFGGVQSFFVCFNPFWVS